jgi:hypothetical protein
MCPYGIWDCADGRQVMFNRDYLPILQRFPGQRCRAADLGEWVVFYKQRWLYSDGTPFKQILINAALADWGLPPMPRKPSGNRSINSHIYRRHWPNPYAQICGGSV